MGNNASMDVPSVADGISLPTWVTSHEPVFGSWLTGTIRQQSGVPRPSPNYSDLPDLPLLKIAAMFNEQHDGQNFLAFRSTCKRLWKLLDYQGLLYIRRLSHQADQESAHDGDSSEEPKTLREAMSEVMGRDYLCLHGEQIGGAWTETPAYYGKRSIGSKYKSLVLNFVWWFDLNGSFQGVPSGRYALNISYYLRPGDYQPWLPRVICKVNDKTIHQVFKTSPPVSVEFVTTPPSGLWSLVRVSIGPIHVSHDDANVSFAFQNTEATGKQNFALEKVHLVRL